MRNKLFWLLASISILTLLPFLGLNDFHTKGEPREAVVSYAMLESGNWILPLTAGGDIAYKPPFFHWSIAALSAPFGEVTEYTSRLPSALALIAMILGLFLFFSKRSDPFRSFLACLITLSAFEVHRAGMNARVDMVLTAMIVLAVIRLYIWWEKDFRGIPWVAILLMSAGVLTKGPVGFILPCASCGLFLLFNKVNFWKAFGKMALAGVLACVLPALWYVMAYRVGGSEFVDLVMEENFGRFLGKMSYESHENPVYYNFLTVLSGYLPWTLLFVIALFFLPYREAKRTPRQLWKQTKEWFRTTDRVRLFSLLTILVIFVFYCIPKSKRSVYLLPIYPFIGFFMADAFMWMAEYKKQAFRIFGWIIASLSVIAMVLIGAVRMGIFDPTSMLSVRKAQKIAIYIDAIRETPISFIAIVSVAILIAFLLVFFRDQKPREMGLKVMLSVVGLVFSLQLMLDGALLPMILNAKSTKNFSHEVARIVPEGKIYGFTNVGMLRFYIANFYTGNRVWQFEVEKPEEGYLLVGDKALPELEKLFPGAYHFESVLRTPHNDTEVRDFVGLYHFRKVK